MRPPATSSAYHRFANDFFYEALAHFAGRPGVSVVLLPRYREQAEHVRSLGLASVVISDRPLDGLSLVAWSDAVVSAGGSMNREAVALGTPAYSVFAGRMAGVDERLIAAGRLTHLRTRVDLDRVTLRTQERRAPAAADGAAISQVLEAVLSTPGLAARS
jgi:predicted glycosyltransferase